MFLFFKSYNVYRWLVGHSYVDSDARTVSSARTALDELSPAQFIWEPYAGILDRLPDYCLAGRPLWRYRGPLICVYIVEPHQHHAMMLRGQKVLDYIQTHQPSVTHWQHRMEHIWIDDLIDGDATIPEYMDWYLPRTVRFLSHIGALHVHLVSIFSLLYLHFL